MKEITPMKKIVSLLLAALMLLSVGSAMAESTYAVTEPINITFWHSLSNEPDVELLTRMVKDFEASQPNVTVTMEYIGNYNAINEKLVSAHAAGTGLPGVAIINVPRLTSYAEGGLVEDLTPYIAANNYDMSDFGAGFVDAMNVKGVQTALPFMESGQVFFYNKTVLDELGLTFPTEWAGMDEYVKTVFEKTGKPAISILGYDNAYFYNLFVNVGAYMINEDGMTTGLDKPAALELIKQLADWVDKGYVTWYYSSDAASNCQAAFTSGETMGVLYTTTLYDDYKAGSNFEVSIALNPKSETAYHMVAGGTLILPAKNTQAVKNASFLLASYLAGPKYNIEWAKTTSYLPTRKSVIGTPEYEDYLKTLPAMRIVVENLDLMVKKTQHALFDTCGDIFERNLAEMMLEDVDLEAGWHKLVNEINDYLADQ